MSDILRNTAVGMVAGAQLGLQVGRDLRDRMQANAVEDKWRDYAASLEGKVKVLQRELTVAEIDAEANRFAAAVVQERNDKLESTVHSLEKDKAELVEDQKAQSAQSKAQADHIAYLNRQVGNLMRVCKAASADATAYEQIFAALYREIEIAGDVDKFQSLNFASRQEAYKRAHDGFKKTGQFIFEPDAKFPAAIPKTRP